MDKTLISFTGWIRKIDQHIEDRVQEIIELNAPQDEMNAVKNENHILNNSPLTERK
jgi:hypothetical protein